jgi:hypothetical protein
VLRRVLLVVGVAGLIAAVLCLLVKAYIGAAYLFVESGVLTAAIIFERSRYGGSANPGSGRWQATGERFVDPTTGDMVAVYYNAETGERDYRHEPRAG